MHPGASEAACGLNAFEGDEGGDDAGKVQGEQVCMVQAYHTAYQHCWKLVCNRI